MNLSTKIYSWAMFIGAVLTLAMVPVMTALAEDNPIEGEVNAGTAQTPLENWQLIVAFVLPLVIAAVIQNGYSEKTQALIMMAAAAVVTVVTLYLQGDLTVRDSGESWFKVVALTIAYYKGIWKPVGTAPQIQNSINPGPA